jgi:hypothetical protein
MDFTYNIVFSGSRGKISVECGNIVELKKYFIDNDIAENELLRVDKQYYKFDENARYREGKKIVLDYKDVMTCNEKLRV